MKKQMKQNNKSIFEQSKTHRFGDGCPYLIKIIRIFFLTRKKVRIPWKDGVYAW